MASISGCPCRRSSRKRLQDFDGHKRGGLLRLALLSQVWSKSAVDVMAHDDVVEHRNETTSLPMQHLGGDRNQHLPGLNRCVDQFLEFFELRIERQQVGILQVSGARSSHTGRPALDVPVEPSWRCSRTSSWRSSPSHRSARSGTEPCQGFGRSSHIPAGRSAACAPPRPPWKCSDRWAVRGVMGGE